MKKAIFCVAIGKKNQMYKLSIKSIAQYAKKIGVEFILLEKPYFNVDWAVKPIFEIHKKARYAWVEKLYAIKLLEDYDRVLMMDVDILVTPNAPDIFETYPDTNKLYALSDTLYTQNENYEGAKEPKRIQAVLGKIKDWPTQGKLPRYFNTGVVLLSKNKTLSDNFSLDDVKKIFNQVHFIEQTYLDYLCFKHDIPVADLDPKFNWIPWLANKKQRNQAYFSHHGNHGYGISKSLRIQKFTADYAKHYHSLFRYLMGSPIRKMSALLILLKHNVKKLLREKH